MRLTARTVWEPEGKEHSGVADGICSQNLHMTVDPERAYKDKRG